MGERPELADDIWTTADGEEHTRDEADPASESHEGPASAVSLTVRDLPRNSRAELEDAIHALAQRRAYTVRQLGRSGNAEPRILLDVQAAMDVLWAELNVLADKEEA